MPARQKTDEEKQASHEKHNAKRREKARLDYAELKESMKQETETARLKALQIFIQNAKQIHAKLQESL